MNTIKSDIPKFEQFDTFDTQQMDQIKFKNQIEELVNLNFTPIEVNVGQIDQKQMKYPSMEDMIKSFNLFTKDQEKMNQPVLEDFYSF